MENNSVLPPDFVFLAEWSDWVLADELARRQKCALSSMAEIQRFYDAMLNAMDGIIEHLNGFPIEDMPGAERNLLHLALAFVEASMSVEMFEKPEMEYGMSLDRFKPAHHEVP